VSDSTISGNAALSYGGGIMNYYASGSASATVTGSTITNNTCLLGKGGGIYNEETLSVTGSDISDNGANDAGGIYLYDDIGITIGESGNPNAFTDNYRTGMAPSAEQHLRYTNRDCHNDNKYQYNTFIPY